jgi:DNA-binding XRE family transcriptional regulator
MYSRTIGKQKYIFASISVDGNLITTRLIIGYLDSILQTKGFIYLINISNLERRSNNMKKDFSADKLTECQKASGKTNEEIAEALGIHVNTWINWKNGDSEPKVNHIIYICDYFDKPLSYFCGGDK